MLKFPKDFVWGSSTSGPQTEGRVPGDGKGDNLWDYWYQVEPNRYYNGIGPDKTSTFYENWEKDIELLLETGHTAFRTSIQWSRIFPIFIKSRCFVWSNPIIEAIWLFLVPIIPEIISLAVPRHSSFCLRSRS